MENIKISLVKYLERLISNIFKYFKNNTSKNYNFNMQIIGYVDFLESSPNTMIFSYPLYSIISLNMPFYIVWNFNNF